MRQNPDLEGKQKDAEFIIITSNMIASIIGDLDIRTFKDIERIMQLVGDI